MTSSGAFVTERIRQVDCESCDFEGLVDIRDDHETRYSGWECPDCGHEHSWHFSDEDQDGDH